MDYKIDLILALCKNKRVLHIGATDYPYHIEKAKKNKLLHQKLNQTCKELIGIDIVKKAISDLQDQFNIQNIYYGDIIKNEFEIKLTKKFDIVVFADVIEHLDNPGIALENLKKLMNKKTKLILTTPNVWTIFTITNHFREKENVHPDHVFWPSKKTMDNLIKNHKLKIKFFKYVQWGSSKDQKSLKGKIFEKIFLERLPDHLRTTLFYILQK